MQSQTRKTVYVALSIIIVCVAMLTCEATGRFNRPIDSGQPRELINNPTCGSGAYDESQRCEIVHQS